MKKRGRPAGPSTQRSEYSRRDYKLRPEFYAAKARRYRYGDHVDRLWAQQEGRCANPQCRAELADGFNVDHDRTCCPTTRTCGGCVRGLLCPGCNRALGQVHDSPDRLIGLAEYIRHVQPAPRNQMVLFPSQEGVVMRRYVEMP